MTTKIEIETALRKAEEDPFVFFGSNPDEVLRGWKIATHPDKWPDCTDEAKHWFTRFTELSEQSRSPRKIGDYRIKRTLATGDLCEVLIGASSRKEFLIKKPLVKAPSLMKNEWTALEKVRAGAKDQAKHLFPVPVERVDDSSVFDFDSELETVASLMQRYPDGVGGRHIGWIFKRILLALTWTHAAGYVHGAVTPEHILVSKKNHGIVLCDWIHCGAPGSAIKIVPKKYKDTYPKCAVDSKSLSPEMDISMAAAIARKLGGDDVPMGIKSYITALTKTNCVRDVGAWNLHEEFDAVLRRAYGAPKFIELV